MFDIIIIGGGISGLHTYYKLIQQNKYNKILLLEKNDYFGGRILQIQKTSIIPTIHSQQELLVSTKITHKLYNY